MKLIIAGGRDFEDKVLAVNSFIELIAEVNYNLIPNAIPTNNLTEQNNDAKSIVVRENPFTEIVSGGARGADRVGEFVAQFYNIPVKRFIPDWDTLGKRAGYVRNAEMAEYVMSDYNDGEQNSILQRGALLAFWDKKSKGTGHMINIAKQKGLIVKVVYY